jgi:putative hydrolase
MSMPGPGPGGGDFLERILSDLVGMIGGSAGGTRGQLELARTFAHSVATSGSPEPNVEPVARMQLEELARVAELHVTELTGLPVTPSGAPVEVVAVGPGMWAWQTVEDWKFVLDAMSGVAQRGDSEDRQTRQGGRAPGAGGSAPAEGLGLTGLEDLPGPLSESPEREGNADILARFMSTMGPMLASMQLGSAVGHLARSTLGQYEIPVPRPTARLLLLPANIDRFAGDWSLPVDEVRLWVCLRELTTSAVLTRPHVAARLQELINAVVAGAAEDAAGALGRLGEIDLQDPEGLQRLLGDPEALLSAEPSPQRRNAAERLEAVTAALLGYIEFVLDRAAARLLGGRSALAEAWRRRQHERGSSERAVEILLGLDLGPAQIERGTSFVEGVVEREGEEGLSLLWSEARTLPTPSEVDAPGLWLERLRLGGEAER